MPSSWTVLIAVHAVAASYALIFGAVNLLRRTKGGDLHRAVGRIWVAAMYIVVLTFFGIRTIDGGFNWLHALSALTFCTLTAGLWAVRKGNIRAHRSFMTGSYFGLLGAFVGVLAVPSRRIPQHHADRTERPWPAAYFRCGIPQCHESHSTGLGRSRSRPLRQLRCHYAASGKGPDLRNRRGALARVPERQHKG